MGGGGGGGGGGGEGLEKGGGVSCVEGVNNSRQISTIDPVSFLSFIIHLVVKRTAITPCWSNYFCFTRVSLSLSLSLSVRLSICLSVSLHQAVCLSDCLSVCLSSCQTALSVSAVSLWSLLLVCPVPTLYSFVALVWGVSFFFSVLTVHSKEMVQLMHQCITKHCHYPV